MSKGLEALERIIGCSTIESHTKKWQQDYYTVKKALKVFEIIKKKQVNCYDIINSIDYKHYLVLMKDYDKSWLLTQEEYDLLKEVLL